jgi:NAD-dependent dihydropyrimidine dehydrogenase PreA subunit
MYVVTVACVNVKDRSCVEECPVDCLYEGEQMMYIHPDECIDCGACEVACPVDAIYAARNLPDSLRGFAAVNGTAVDAIGSPGGSHHVTHLLVDPPRPDAGAV